MLNRFHPDLRLNLISAGSPNQTAAGLQTRRLLDILLSSRPDWVVVGIGLADALREPELSHLVGEYLRVQAASNSNDQTFGPEYRLDLHDLGPVSDIGGRPRITAAGLDSFATNLKSALAQLADAGVGTIVLTSVLVGDDPSYPLNLFLKAYSKAICTLVEEQNTLIVDVERAFSNLFARAGQYKQKVALASLTGELTLQGQALLARTFLEQLGLLPYPGFRPTSGTRD